MSENPSGAAGTEGDVSTLPEWARNSLKRANDEAAKFRVEKREAVDGLEAAKKAAADEVAKTLAAENEKILAAKDTEIGTLRTELVGAKLGTVKLRAAIDAGVPVDKLDSFTELLKGEDEAGIRTHAGELVKLFGASQGTIQPDPATDPSQGQSNPLPLNGDGLLNALRGIVGS